MIINISLCVCAYVCGSETALLYMSLSYITLGIFPPIISCLEIGQRKSIQNTCIKILQYLKNPFLFLYNFQSVSINKFVCNFERIPTAEKQNVKNNNK